MQVHGIGKFFGKYTSKHATRVNVTTLMKMSKEKFLSLTEKLQVHLNKALFIILKYIISGVVLNN